MNFNSSIALYEASDGSVRLDVKTDGETVWLNRNQMALLFDRDVKTIGKHVHNALQEELRGVEATVADFATVQNEGGRTVSRSIEYYNLDVIISVGYRVKSQRGIDFRRWANRVLKDYILKGYALNDSRLKHLQSVVQVMKRAESLLDSGQVLNVIERYTTALDMLDDYDYQRLKKPDGSAPLYLLTYDDGRAVIDSLKFGAESALFGNEKDQSFKGSIGAIYQSFGGIELYPSAQEKAANLLYFVTKNHSFSDGNKRIAAALFLYFLDKNGLLFIDGEKRIDDNTLVAVTIMIAESRPEEKETLVKLIMNFLD